MSDELWTDVDEYLVSHLLVQDDALDEALTRSEAAGLPRINVAANQGKFLELLAKIQGSRRILEIGTLGGYSTIWLARALPADGRLVTLELNPAYAAVAAANIERAGLSSLIKIDVGPARDSLRALIDQDAGPFDLVFIDADKQGTPEYFQLALELTRPGSVIVTDNVVRDGELANDATEDERACLH